MQGHREKSPAAEVGSEEETDRVDPGEGTTIDVRRAEPIAPTMIDPSAESAAGSLEPEEAPDPRTEAALRDLDDERQQLENEEFRQILELRKKFAGRIFTLTCCWVGAVFALLTGVGFFPAHEAFHLPNDVLIAAVGSTAIPGLLAIVLRYLFPSSPESK